MKTPLIRQGGGPAALTEIYQTRDQERRDLDRMLTLSTAPETTQDRRRRGLIAHRSPAGDEHRLRMIPAIARGVAGAIPGTSPHRLS